MKKSLEFLFKIFLCVINFFIFIGELSQKIFFILLRIFKFILRPFQLLFPFLYKQIIRLFSYFGKLIDKGFKKLKNKFFSLVFKIKPCSFVTSQDFLNSLALKFKFFILGCLITFLVIFSYQTYLFLKTLPSPADIGKVNYPLSTHILDRKGKLLYEIFRDQNRTPISLNDLPKYTIEAAISIEDKDFFRHQGVSLFGGIFRAIKDMIKTKNLQGGSTITQQLVKSALLTPERTIKRKIKEIILALWAEKLYTKNQILEMYFNQVPYGGSAYGIEEASKTYFGKHVKDLSLSEVAFLAGLPQAPSLYSPYVNPKLGIQRRNEVLEKMEKYGYIDKAVKLKAQGEPLIVVQPTTAISAPHFVFYVKSKLEEKYGIKTVEEGGLKVMTTLDLDIQQEAEKILKEELEKIKNLNVTNGAILVTKPSTGEILAMVGSVDYFALPYGAFNVTTALRQPGSSIKPLMYSLALEKGYTSATTIDDAPVVFSIEGSESYKPVNYDGSYHGRIPLRYALANSYNIPAVKVLNSLGVENFINHAEKMGISTWTDHSLYGLSLTLGGGEVTMTDMAQAFGVLANSGYKAPLNYYAQINNSSNETISSLNSVKAPILDEGISYIISDILADSFARQWAFGPRSALEIPGYKVAVKTGTTNDKKDNWTIGYTPDFLVTVWVGNNDNSPMNPYLSSGITGAAPIWNRVMSYLLKTYTDKSNWYSRPDDVVEKNCYFGKPEYFISGTENKVSCSQYLFNQTPTPTKSD